MPASPFASRGSGRPIQMERTDHSVEGNPTGASGPHATAACPLIGAMGRLARATTDSHREARPARIASGASTLHQPLLPLRAGWPPGPSPHDAAPTPSLSQWRAELRRPDGGREGLASFVGARGEWNDSDQRLETAGLATSKNSIASPLHRLVRHLWAREDRSASQTVCLGTRRRHRSPRRCCAPGFDKPP